MPNGDDKNWVRLCAAINGFRSRYHAWPTQIRLLPGCLEDLRGHLFSSEAFAKVEEKLIFIPDAAVGMAAEDESGRKYDYGHEGFPKQPPDVHAVVWLGVEPDQLED